MLRIRKGTSGLAGFLMAIILPGGMLALPLPQASQNQDSPEITTKDSELNYKFKAESNVVIVRVVARDARGHTVAHLHKEDFRLLDNGKPQIIQEASAESPSSTNTPAEETASQEVGVGTKPPAAPLATNPFSMPPTRYLAVFFDDIHLNVEDLYRTRDAAVRYLGTALQRHDRAAIFTASGENVLDFTDDRAKLDDTLARIIPRPMYTTEVDTCPPITEYQAYLIAVEHDPTAAQIAAEQYFVRNCLKRPPQAYESCRNEAGREVDNTARSLSNLGQTRSERVMRQIAQMIRLMSPLPGERSIILVSPGFLKFTLDAQVNQIIDGALRSNIVISALDAKGLFATAPMGDASERNTDIASAPGQPKPATPGRGGVLVSPVTTQSDLVNIQGFGGEMAGRVSQIRMDGINRAADAMSDLASATGGVVARNTNDYDEAFRKAGGLPEEYYVLRFSPQDLQLDGKFHSLRVELAGVKGVTLEARRGYYAPSGPLDAEVQANQELQDVAFTKEEVNEFPVEVSTQFLKSTAGEARLNVLTHVDLRGLHFRKVEGRSLDGLTFVSALFDQSGRLVKGKQKEVQFRLRDATLDRLTKSGVAAKTEFEVGPGTYLLRQIVREGGTARVTALNRTVDIP